MNHLIVKEHETYMNRKYVPDYRYVSGAYCRAGMLSNVGHRIIPLAQAKLSPSRSSGKRFAIYSLLCIAMVPSSSYFMITSKTSSKSGFFEAYLLILRYS